MRAHVHRHVVDDGREVGAVVEVETAQEVLVGLARPGMLDGDQAGHGFQQLGHAQQGSHGQVGATDRALAGRISLADHRLAAREHDDFLEHIPGHCRCAGQQRRHASEQIPD
jgi:hypothetical protein